MLSLIALNKICQDTLSKAREVALRILQNTVYQMVEQIPQVFDIFWSDRTYLLIEVLYILFGLIELPVQQHSNHWAEKRIGGVAVWGADENFCWRNICIFIITMLRDNRQKRFSELHKLVLDLFCVGQRKPLEALVAEVKKTLEASKLVSNYKG